MIRSNRSHVKPLEREEFAVALVELETAVPAWPKYRPALVKKARSLSNSGMKKRWVRDSGSSPADEEIAAWIGAIADRGDREAFTRLFDVFAPRLKAFALQLGCDGATAEEIVQDVMVSVWRRAGQYDPSKGRPVTWIYTIARNRRIDLFRRQPMPTADPDDLAFVPSDDESLDDQVYRREYSSKLHKAMADLPEEQLKLLRMAFFKELSHSEIAAECELPIGTVKSRIRLAMQKLRTRLGEDV
jgi:RNA polymerase sigma-70 factor (ECF subfamily)